MGARHVPVIAACNDASLPAVGVRADRGDTDFRDVQGTHIKLDSTIRVNAKVGVTIALGLWLRAILISMFVLSYIGARLASPRPASTGRMLLLVCRVVKFVEVICIVLPSL